ncbi:MotE family protein [Paracoccaceae bacterium GXU_MW_L88]
MKRKLTVIGVLVGAFALSMALRIGTHGPAWATEIAAAGDCTDAAPEGLIAAVRAEEARLKEEREKFEAQKAGLDQERADIEEKQRVVAALESDLKARYGDEEDPKEKDLAKLTAMYANMDPKAASGIVATMDTTFAAGLMGRMDPAAAAAIFANMPPENAYAITVIIAGRNAG